MATPQPQSIELRVFQREALQQLGRSSATDRPNAVLCISPTGSGKSRIFQQWILSRRQPSRVLLVVPLLALGEQQSRILRGLGITTVGRAQSLNSCMRAWLGQDPRVVWITSPERLLSSGLDRFFHEHAPDLVVLDEIHTYWEWGTGFRSSMRTALALLEKIKPRWILGLTATLPAVARNWLVKEVPSWQWAECGARALPDGLEVSAYKVPFRERSQWLLANLTQTQGGLLYLSTRKAVDHWASWLARVVPPEQQVIAYRGGWSSEERSLQLRQIEREFRNGHSPWIIATSAFGLGMDFPGLDRVIAVHPLMTPLATAQVLGRAGRNGRRGLGQILWSEEDFRLQSWAFSGKSASGESREPLIHEAIKVLKWLDSGAKKQDLLALLVGESSVSTSAAV